MTTQSGSASGFSQIFDSGSGSQSKTQNPAGADSGSVATSGNHPAFARFVEGIPPLFFVSDTLSSRFSREVSHVPGSTSSALIAESCSPPEIKYLLSLLLTIFAEPVFRATLQSDAAHSKSRFLSRDNCSKGHLALPSTVSFSTTTTRKSRCNNPLLYRFKRIL